MSETTAWLQELAAGHYQGNWCITEVWPWAMCQDVLVLPLVFDSGKHFPTDGVGSII